MLLSFWYERTAKNTFGHFTTICNSKLQWKWCWGIYLIKGDINIGPGSKLTFVDDLENNAFSELIYIQWR